MAEKNGSQPGSMSQHSNSYTSSKSMSPPAPASDDYLPTYPARGSAYSSQSAPAQPVKSAAAVVVKHKTTRQYDPDAVARLKEKLGLSRSLEEKKETVE
jgi:ProP effector